MEFGVISCGCKEWAGLEDETFKVDGFENERRKSVILRKLVKNISSFCLFSPPVFYKKVCLGITLPADIDVRCGCFSFPRFRTHSTKVDGTLKRSLYMDHRYLQLKKAELYVCRCIYIV